MEKLYGSRKEAVDKIGKALSKMSNQFFDLFPSGEDYCPEYILDKDNEDCGTKCVAYDLCEMNSDISSHWDEFKRMVLWEVQNYYNKKEKK